MIGISLGPFSPASTYGDLINLDANGQGLTTVPVPWQDGFGNLLGVYSSTQSINFDRTQIQFQLDGVALTATASVLNSLTFDAAAPYIVSSSYPSLPNAIILAAGSGISLTPSGGNYTIAASGELAGLNSLSTTGLVVRTGLGTYTTDLITNGDGTITVTNGDGVAGNPTIIVNPSSCVQKINTDLNGILTSTRSTLNFIPGTNIGVNIVDNAGLNRTDITLTSSSNAFPFKTACYAGTTGTNLVTIYSNGSAGIGATLTNNDVQAAFSLDGTSPPLNSRILIKDQTTSYQNGIYVLTTVGSGASNWVLTRSLDFDQPSEIQPGDYTIVTNGTVNSNTSWIQTATVNTIGSDPIVWAPFGFVGTVTSVSGTAGQIDVANGTTTPVISIDAGYVGQTSITTLGVVTTGTWESTEVALAYGGTNANLTASDGGIFYSTATAGAILSGTGTADRILQSGANTGPHWSTATYPGTTTINEILYSSAANTITGLATANNGVLITSAGGVPSISSTLPTAVQTNITEVGTITVGVWTGTTIAIANGGTGATDAPDALTNLGALPIAGGTMTGYLILNGDPVTALGAVTKQYADAISAGLYVKAACYAGSTVSLTVTYNNGAAGVGATLTNAGVQAAFSIDGVSPALNSRILIKNQSVNQFQNGIYTVTTIGTGLTNWVLTRSLDYDMPSEIQAGDFILITAGTVNTNTAWIETSTVNNIGIDSITFSQYGNPGTVTSVSGTAGQIDVANGTSTPVISIDSGYVGQTSITTLGTIVTAVWHGSIIALAYGGTNANLTASNGGIFYSTASAGAILAGTATARQMLQSGASTTPAWSTATYPATTTVSQLLYSSSANVIGGITTANSGVLVTNSTGVPAWSGTMTNGQVIIGSTSGTPATATLTAGTGISITNASNSITINSNGASMPVVDQNTGSVTMAVNTVYIIDNGASLVTLTLPSTASLGDQFIITGYSSGGWKVGQAASQIIHFNSTNTTSGTGGSLASTNQYNSLTLRCVQANTDFTVVSSSGVLTVV